MTSSSFPSREEQGQGHIACLKELTEISNSHVIIVWTQMVGADCHWRRSVMLIIMRGFKTQNLSEALVHTNPVTAPMSQNQAESLKCKQWEGGTLRAPFQAERATATTGNRARTIYWQKRTHLVTSLPKTTFSLTPTHFHGWEDKKKSITEINPVLS